MSADSPEALSAAFAEAINSGDVDVALELWIEEAAILRPDGQQVRGREAIGAALHALVENGASVEVKVLDLFAAGDVALATGTLTITGTGADGSPYSQQSESLVIYSRADDGRWRLAIDAPWGLPSSI